MKKRVFITGAGGQVGTALVAGLADSWEILATDRIRPGAGMGSAEFRLLDITRIEHLRDLLASWQPAAVVNLAAVTDVDGCERDPESARLVNTQAVWNLLAALPGANVHFIQISTDYIFDGRRGPYPEEARPNPLNVYGRTKLDAERLIQSRAVPWTILRTNVVYGYTPETGASFLKWVLDELRRQHPIRVVDDQWNNPTWTVGLAECIHAVLDQGLTGIYNYAGADYCHRLDFARKIAAAFQLDPGLISAVSTPELGQAAARPLRGGLITRKIEHALGIRCYPILTALNRIKLQVPL